MHRTITFIVFSTLCLSAQAATYYVDRNHRQSSDGNTGSESQPWKTIVHAGQQAKAGDTIYIKAGVYEDGDVVVANSGLPDQRIVFSAFPGDERRAIIRGAAFLSTGNSHITVQHLKLEGTPRYGIRFEGPEDTTKPPAKDILIKGNHTYDTCSSGISVWGVDWGEDPGDYDNIRDVMIEENLVELGTNGCKNEIITVANGAVEVTVRNNIIRLGDPNMEGGDEGIDFKEGVRDSYIYGNVIYDLSDKAIYIDGGSDPRDPLITNIHIFNNVMYDLPSAGIVITTEGMGDVDGIFVYNNVVYDVTGDGYRVYDHPGGNEEGGTVRNVHFINNTAFNTGTEYGGGFRVNHATATGIIFRNNISWANNNYDIRGADETLIEYNLCGESLCEIRSDPLFVDPENNNFQLQSSSPALDQGSSVEAPAFDLLNVVRPQGDGIDLGSYERAVDSVAVPRPPENLTAE